MYLKDLIDFNDKKSRKLVMMSVYTILAFVIIYFFFRKRTPPTQTAPAPKQLKREDTRPRISIAGSLISPRELITLSKICKFSRLHLVFKVRNNDEETQIKEMLKDIGVLNQNRILFCETDIGYKAILRQLNPQLHIEENLQLAQEMSAYLNAIVIIGDEEFEQFYQIIEFRDCEGMIVNILNDLH